jgi:uncharacterized protein (DUF58 family)
MIPKEILKQIRKIEIRSGKLVNEIFAGQYSSVFKGQGMEFSEVREYTPGDDIRSIDWNVTARYGKPFVKKFVEERELTVIFVVDVSGSQNFGTKDKFKAELAAELASVLAFSAIKNNDRVGMIMFTDRIEKVIRPKKGKNHTLRLIREILFFKPEGKGTNISFALQYLNEVWRRKAVVFLISDFNDKNFEKSMKITSKKHDLIAVKISDPREKMLPDIGLLEIEDSETGNKETIDTSDHLFVDQFNRKVKQKEEEIKTIFKKSSVDNIILSTGQPYIVPLVQFFKLRERRIARG